MFSSPSGQFIFKIKHAHICPRPRCCDSPSSHHTSRTEGRTGCCLHTATGILCTLLVATHSSAHKRGRKVAPACRSGSPPPHFNLYLLVRPVPAVLLAVAKPLLLQTLVAVRTSELRRAARGSRAVHLVGAVAAVGISVTSQTLGHALTASTAILVNRTSHRTWTETRCHHTSVSMETKATNITYHTLPHRTRQRSLSRRHTGRSSGYSECCCRSADGSPRSDADSPFHRIGPDSRSVRHTPAQVGCICSREHTGTHLGKRKETPSLKVTSSMSLLFKTLQRKHI